MATVTTDRTATNAIGKYSATGVFSDTATYECDGVVSVADTVIQMIKVNGADAPGGITVLDMFLDYDDLGTLTADVGDGDDVVRFMEGVDVGAGGGRARQGHLITANPFTAFPKTYTANDTIDVKLLTGTATGTITLTVLMTAGAADLA